MLSSVSRGKRELLIRGSSERISWPCSLSLELSEEDNLLGSHNILRGITCLEKKGWGRRLIMASLVSEKLECCMARFMFPYVEISFLKVFLFNFSLTVVVTEMFLLKVSDTQQNGSAAFPGLPADSCDFKISSQHSNTYGEFTKISFE